jgi:hypothetical protein
VSSLKYSTYPKWFLIIIISISILSSTSISTLKQAHQLDNNFHRFQTIDPSPNNVYNDIEVISDWYRYLDTPGHKNAENYIFSRFESFGLNTSCQEYTCRRVDGDVTGVNVLGLLEGHNYPNFWLVIGGHYDANQYALHGAYDNAVGVATVIELARCFTGLFTETEGPKISILFAAWDSEEGGGAGSKYFLDNLGTDISVVACINLDMYSLNYPIRNSIPGSTEEYFKLYLYTSPTTDFSGYSNIDFNESTRNNFTNFQNMLINITYNQNDYPMEWVPVLDDTEIVSDHSHFIRESIPAVWFRGMNEYPRDERDLNERNFKHTPMDTLDTMEFYAGGKNELLNGIDTGLVISYQLVLALNDQFNDTIIKPEISHDAESDGIMSGFGNAGWLIAVVILIIIFTAIYYYKSAKGRKFH